MPHEQRIPSGSASLTDADGRLKELEHEPLYVDMKGGKAKWTQSPMYESLLTRPTKQAGESLKTHLPVQLRDQRKKYTRSSHTVSFGQYSLTRSSR